MNTGDALFRRLSSRRLFFACMAGALALAAPAADAVTILPGDDVSVRSGRGNLDESDPLGLLVKEGGSASFVEFAFGQSAVSAAALFLHNNWSNASAPVSYDIAVRAAPFAFDENILADASRPDTSGWTVVVESFHVDNTPRGYELDITDFYNAHLGETITFSLQSAGGSGDGPIFDDREGTGGHAQGPRIEATVSEGPPLIEEVAPDPETVEAGSSYERRLTLLDGSPPVAWSVIQGPPGLAVDGEGIVSGWTPGETDAGKTFTIEVEASNTFGSDNESWQVIVVAPPPDPLVGGGWVAHYYKPAGEVTAFEDLDSLEPKGAGIVAAIDTGATSGQFVPRGLDFVDDFAVRYEGLLTVAAGVTAFHVTADDGARLFIDGALVVEKTGGGFDEVSADADLEAGAHCIVVEYFEHQGSAGIRVEYTPPGGARSVIPPSVMEAEPCLSGKLRVPAWRMLEIALTGSGRPANPFTDVQLTAEVTDPEGRVLTVDGYFDGDGRGGQEGNIWKLRLTPDRPGAWTWTASSGNPALDGQGGTFECIPSEDPGAVEAKGRSFFRADGTPVFLLGNFLDRAAGANEEFSHTLLSEKISSANRQHMIERHRDFHRANKMNVYLANQGDYGGISTTPWLGTSGSNDKSRFDLERWRMYDEVTARLRDEGMEAELWFFADDSNFGNLPDADRRRLIQYGMARLSAYAHTMFVLALEWQEGWSASEVRSHAAFLVEHNPWSRLVSVHGTTGNFSFPGDAWADFMATQSGNSVTPAANNTHAITNRNLAAKPLIVEEFGILDTATDSRLRGNLWGAFCGGAAGTGTGSELARLRRFIETTGVRFWRMAPANSLASKGFVLAEKGSEYVVYVDDTQEFTLQLEPGDYRAEWFNPRAAAGDAGPVPAGKVSGGTRSFAPPDRNDWVLHVVAAAQVEPLFVRADANSDGSTDLSDSVFVLQYLFLGGPAPACEEAADANGDGSVDISDALHLLNHLFLGGLPPPPPFPDCGTDESTDLLSCDAYAPCAP